MALSVRIGATVQLSLHEIESYVVHHVAGQEAPPPVSFSPKWVIRLLIAVDCADGISRHVALTHVTRS